MSDDKPNLYREKRPHPSNAELAERKAKREAEAAEAMAEVEERQRTLRENMERLRAERLAKNTSGKGARND